MVKDLVIKVLGFFVPEKDRIYLESKPPFSDNSYNVYLEMIKQELNNEYEIIWIYDSYDEYNNSIVPDDLPENVKIVRFNKNTIIGRIGMIFHLLSGKAYIMSNSAYFGRREKNINVYLSHGVSFKKVDEPVDYFKRCKYILTLSSNLIPITAVDCKTTEDKVLPIGFPRNDYFGTIDCEEVRKKCGFSKYSKIIVWMPTIRKRWNSDKSETEKNYFEGIPLIDSQEDIIQINDVLKELNFLLVIKMHFAQDNKTYNKKQYSNVRIYTNRDLENAGVQLNEFLASTDALLTDYSSVYFDYLLNDKPIGLVIDDLEEYSRHPGILYDYYNDIFGDYIYSLDDLMSFISKTVESGDVRAIKDAKERYHDHLDCKSTERFVAFLKDRLNEY